MKPQSFHVTEDQYEILQAKATAAGLPVLTGEGQFTVDHCSFTFSHDIKADIVTITCTAKPFYVSEGRVYDHVSELMEPCEEVYLDEEAVGEPQPVDKDGNLIPTPGAPTGPSVNLNPAEGAVTSLGGAQNS